MINFTVGVITGIVIATTGAAGVVKMIDHGVDFIKLGLIQTQVK